MSKLKLGDEAPAAMGRGFTLVELMVTVAIVAILAAIAYLSQMKKSRRSEAEQFLMDVAQREQQYLLDQRAYAPDLATLNMTAPSDVQTFYSAITINVTAGPPTGFTATAAPKSGTTQAGDYTVIIDNLGNKQPVGVW